MPVFKEATRSVSATYWRCHGRFEGAGLRAVAGNARNTPNRPFTLEPGTPIAARASRLCGWHTPAAMASRNRCWRLVGRLGYDG